MSDTTEGAPPAGQPPPSEPGPVPYSRFAQVNTAAQAAKAEAEAAKAEAAAAKAQAEEIRKQHAAQAAAWGDERAIMRAGIADDDGIAVVRTLWERIPAEARPPEGISGWLSAMTPDAAPLPLRPYLQRGIAAPVTLPRPAANAGATGAQPASPGAVTVEQYRAARAAALRTPDPRATMAADPIVQAFERAGRR